MIEHFAPWHLLMIEISGSGSKILELVREDLVILNKNIFMVRILQ